MNTHDGFDRTVSDWLDEQAGHGMPGYLDEVLSATTRSRQRPWWASLERLLPVQTTLRFSAAPRIAWLLLVLALVAALGVAALAIGSRHRQPAPPFGLARNGPILYAGIDHDIHALDPVTGVSSLVIAGKAGDRRPLLSPDGTRLLFLRDTDTVPATTGPAPMLMVANADGSDVRALTGNLANFADFGGVAWSHDGSKVVVASDVDSKPALQVFALDGSSRPVVIDTPLMTAIMYVSFRPGDREITFRGSTSDGDGLFAVAPDGGGFRAILRSTVGDGASLSPDGTKIAYQTWDGTRGTIHIVDIDSGLDSVPALDPPSDAKLIDGEPTWSPDGTRFLFVRYVVGATNHLAVAPVTGGARVEIGPSMPNCSCPVSAEFSPDGSTVLAHYGADASTWMLDPRGSAPGKQLLAIGDTASWQRLAP